MLAVHLCVFVFVGAARAGTHMCTHVTGVRNVVAAGGWGLQRGFRETAAVRCCTGAC
jgi:hypothetical protein